MESGGSSKRARGVVSTSSSPPPPPAAASAVWATVPEDILAMVVSRLPTFVDLQRFRCVCRPWRAVAASLDDPKKRRGAPLCPPLPYLLLPGPGGPDDPSRRLLSVADGKIHRLDFPEESRGWWCYGSSGGWLAMVDLVGGIFLFNPISGARVNLPNLSTIPNVKAVFRSAEGRLMWLYKDDSGKTKHSLDWVQYNYVQKVAWSGRPGESDCVVVMIYAWDFKLAYTRVGGQKWRRLNTGDWGYFKDVMYHDAGKRFYAVSFWGSTVSVELPAGGERRPRQTPTTKFLARLPDNVLGYEDENQRMGKYLVGLPSSSPSGALLLVLRHYEYEVGVPYRTEHFQVFFKQPPRASAVDKAEEAAEWMEVESLGDLAIFLGHNAAVCLSSSQVLGGCRPNCIYFTDDFGERFRSELRCAWGDAGEYRGCDVGVFDVQARTTTKFSFPPELESPVVMPTPVWLTPSG